MNMGPNQRIIWTRCLKKELVYSIKTVMVEFCTEFLHESGTILKVFNFYTQTLFTYIFQNKTLNQSLNNISKLCVNT